MGMLRKMIKGMAGATLVMTTIGLAGTGVATAEPLPQLGIWTTTIHTIGDANLCHGDIDIRLEAAHGRPGHVLAHLTPLGFVGGPCGAWVHFNYYNLNFPFYQDTPVYVHAGTGPGPTVTVDLPTGSGVNNIQASTWPLANWGVAYDVLVP